MLQKTIIVIVLLFISKFPLANAVTIEDIGISPRVKTIPELIDEKALQYNVSADVMNKVIFCESSYNTFAIGDGGMSRGLVQIHKKYHPTITDEMAFDEEFAIDFLAKNLSEGRGSMWTCFRLYEKNNG